MPAAPHTAPPAAAPGMTPGVVVLVLSLLLGIQPITTDLYLPALPALTEGFGAPLAHAQLTLTTLLLAFGTSQLVWGPLSDRFGRRPVLIWGMAAYTLASVGCALAVSMPLLIVWRTVQGAAMGAAVMGARAIVRDLYTPETGARVMSEAMSGLGVIACLAAPMGGLVADLLGWRYALGVLVLFGAASLAVVTLHFEESASRLNPNALRSGTLLRTWLTIVRHPTFLTYCALSTAAYAGLFTYLASSSFVYIKVLGFTRTEFGLVLFSSSFVYMMGTFLCRRLLPRYGVQRTLAIAGALTLAGGTIIGVLGLAGVRSGWAILPPFTLFALAHGMHQPCCQSCAVGPFPHAAGAASALNGFINMIAVFIIGGWIGTHLDGTVHVLTNGVWFWSVCISTLAWTVVQKYGDPRRV